jgi:uncharacterized protein
MPIVQQGSINTTALVVPDPYVQIVPPQNLALNGVPTNLIGVVGTATWGPVGLPTVVGNYPEYAQNFGNLVARKYDLGTAVAIAVQQGAQAFTCVRVTDTTDTAATNELVGTGSNGVVFTALYTGTLGNGLTVSISTGSKASSWRVVVALPGLNPEVYDNITGSGAPFWQALAAAINSGTGPLRGPSQLVTASYVGTYTTAAAATSVTLSGGTDGVATLTAAVLVGTDTIPRKGMYALRSQGCSIGVLADADDSTQWTTIDGFGQSEGLYMVQVLPAGTSIASAVTAKATAGLDDYSTKMMHGDWIYWNDQVNGVLRLVSPQGFVAGLLANLSPEQSTLNKQLFGVVGSQKAGVVGSPQQATYTTADLQTLLQAGIDVIMNPAPGGTYWAVRGGRNASSNAAINGDNYTRMTNYIAATLNAGEGIFIGQVINATTLQRIRSQSLSFFANMYQQGMLGSVDGSLPYSVKCDAGNNPQSRTSLGYVQQDIAVQYLGIVWFLITNLEGGQTVIVNSTVTQNGAVVA